ncbi:MAG: ABC transporter substrate-binding protein [Rhodobacteraceae bacterium]|uniref:Iron complex transport system substrate-binding protein n=1 Tax=Salipiger profundus TaxID=1229727 RepID=A0A1U7CZT8_9RHOB|nr:MULTISPECIES: ABC transporter substrate-binding protein [Salipiger]APX21336.1 iron complex transport system substrate-binding protein [Salipiger profundus]MAB08746.1 ABC transporter substrate-binding protein [Paracoccaceae bacterium]GGA03192.1 cobalamin ABC transporter substrate-binding protein [Salipiger profundus]SFC25021.1 iron complex transport system substrate-binding protein [Salipiger profundus]
MQASRLISAAAALLFAGAAALAGAAPERVVSLNVCTDQLALLLGAPGQLVSVSPLARDPRSSAMAEAARAVPVNKAAAEQIVLLEPDLVLAGSYTARAATDMLETLGYRVERFEPARSLEDARDNIRRMGRLLGRENRAAEVLAAFDARLSDLRDDPKERPVVAYYMPFNETAGSESLTGDILEAAGMTTLAEAQGMPYGARLPLEALVLADPDLILVSKPYDSPAQATELLRHPALQATGALRQVVDSPNWICGAPAALDAVAAMRAMRRDWQAAR